MIEQLGKFHIKRLLGSGAMGEVYLGSDPALGREVAIKTILPFAAQETDMKDRFAREARAAGTLNHPNIVTVYEFGEDQGVLFIAMEYVPGHDLEVWLARQNLSRTDILEVLAQVCDGLDYAHRREIIHRDIKPANIRVNREGKRLHTRIMDFGVARMGPSDMTATGIVMGTVSYMAPEYIQTGRLDARGDLFAVGVMLYEALSGHKPFAGDTSSTVLYKIVNEAPPPLDPSQIEGISPAIQQVLDCGLAKDPDQRFQTAEAFAKALRAAKDPTWQGPLFESMFTSRFASEEASAPPRDEPTFPKRVASNNTTHIPAQLKPESRSRMGWLMATVLALLAGGAGLIWQAKHIKREPPPPLAASPTLKEVSHPRVSPVAVPMPSEPLPVCKPEKPLSPLAVESHLPNRKASHDEQAVESNREGGLILAPKPPKPPRAPDGVQAVRDVRPHPQVPSS